MIEIINLTKYFNNKKIISDFSFSANKQECLGLFGENPTVKTALLDVISGSTTPSSGYINIQGFNTKTHPFKAKKLVGYQLHRCVSHPTMSVKEFLDYIAAIRGLRGTEKRAQVEYAATRLELLPVLNAPLEALSMGLRRKVAIAQAILHTPALLLLDEPTEGLAPDQKHTFRSLIQSLMQEMTVIIASRHCDELSELCTRALVIAGDRLVADASMPDLQRDSRHFQAVTLTADAPLDLLALAVLPGVAGIEEHRHAPGTVTVLPMPGHTIYPHINTLIANRRWKINSLSLEPGRLSDVVHSLSREAPPLKLLPVIFKRQLAHYAGTPGTYLSIAIFSVLSVALGLHMSSWPDQDSSHLQIFFQLHPWLYLLLIPVLAAQLWSDESNAGFLDLMKTLPITTFEWVIGKFLAAWVVAGTALMLTFPLVIIANYLGVADNSVIASQFISSWLLAGSYLAVGCFIFTLVRQRTALFLLTVGLMLIVSALSYLLDALEHQAPIWAVDSLVSLSPFSRYSAIDNGKFTLRDTLYFISMILAFLAATTVTLNYKHS